MRRSRPSRPPYESMAERWQPVHDGHRRFAPGWRQKDFLERTSHLKATGKLFAPASIVLLKHLRRRESAGKKARS